MSASLLDLIAPLQPFAQRLVNLAGRAGVQPRVTSTLRTRAQQERLYAAYLRGENHYPVAPPGTSSHEYGFAFDMVAATREDLHDLGKIWTQAGGIWSPEDEVHFQYPGFVSPEPSPDSPTVRSQENILQKAANLYNALPWYATLLVPTVYTTSSKSFAEESRGSIGARFLCSLGVKAFC